MFDEDFFNILKPIYFLHILTCTQKYVITNHTVKFIGVKHFVISVVALIVLLVLLEETLQTFEDLVNLSFFVIYCYNYCSYVVNFTVLCFLNFFYRSVNYKLFSYMCYLNSNLYDKQQSKCLAKLSWGLCSTIIFLYILHTIVKTIADVYWFTLRAVYLITTINFEVEIIYMIFISYFLVCKLDKWVEVVKLRSSIQETDDDEVKDECHRLYLLFKTHLDCMVLMEKTSRFVVIKT